MKKPRVQDIAALAGVSPATVTRVLRGSGYASDDKRELVLQAAKELGYEIKLPSKDGQNPVVLLISHPSFSNQSWLFSNILESICMEIQKLNWQCLTHYVTWDTFDSLPQLIKSTLHMNLKGIIFNCGAFPENYPELRKLVTSLSIPVVMIERFPDVFGIDKIMINAKEAVFLAVRHLYRNGHRKIAFFSPDFSSDVEHARLDGFRSAVTAMHLEEEAHFVPIDDYQAEDGQRALEKYIEAYGLPTAIICADPVMIGISRYLYMHNLRVPEDISLIGVDDAIAGVMTPPLTSVAFPVAEIAKHAVQFLLEEKNQNSLAKTISLSTYLIERETVAPPRE